MAWSYWDYPTNYTGLDNVTGPINGTSDFFLGYPAAITAGLSSSTMMIFLYFVLLALGLPFGVGAAVATASFISFILSSYLWWNGVLAITYPIIFFTLTIVASIIVGNNN